MKLGKSLIITGLLFSSILGSVNVGSITAMAAVQPEIRLNDKVKDDSIAVKYVDLNEEDVAIADLGTNAKKTVPSEDISQPVSLKDFEVSSDYKVIDESVSVENDKSDSTKHFITVKLGRVNVNAKVEDAKNTEAGLPTSVPTRDSSKKVEESNLKIPNGFTFVRYQSGVVTLKKSTVPAPANHRGHGGYVSQRMRIAFIDQDGDEVGYQQISGKATFTKQVSAPTGYSFVNANEANIKFDKSGNKDLKLKVTKNRPVSTMEEGIVTTNSGDFKHLYTIEGKDITNRGLSGDSKWYTDQYATINGEKMFRVATNEWVKATDVYK